MRSGEVTDQFPVLFVPAAYVFAIWGVIYAGLVAFAIFQALPSQRENSRLRRIGGLFVVASLANIAWIFAWHYERFPLSMLFMLILLGSLIGIYLRLGTGRTRVAAAETWAVRVPFSIYLGWITVATIANVSQLLYVLGWGGWGIAPVTWTIIMLAAAVVVAALMAVTRRDVAYLAVSVWAVIGIALKHAATPRRLAGGVGRRCDRRAAANLERGAPAPAAGGRRPSASVKFQHRFSVRAPLARVAEFHTRSASMAAAHEKVIAIDDANLDCSGKRRAAILEGDIHVKATSEQRTVLSLPPSSRSCFRSTCSSW